MKKRVLVLNNTDIYPIPGGIRHRLWVKYSFIFTTQAWKSITNMKNFLKLNGTLTKHQYILSIDKFQELYD